MPKQQIGAGDKTLWIKCLLHKNEDLSSNPQHHSFLAQSLLSCGFVAAILKESSLYVSPLLYHIGSCSKISSGNPRRCADRGSLLTTVNNPRKAEKQTDQVPCSWCSFNKPNRRKDVFKHQFSVSG